MQKKISFLEQYQVQPAKIALILGDDNPYIPRPEFEFIAKQLHPEQIKIAGDKHFIEQSEFAEVLLYIKQND